MKMIYISHTLSHKDTLKKLKLHTGKMM